MCGVMEGLAIVGAVASFAGSNQQASNVSDAAQQNLEAQYAQTEVQAEQEKDTTAVDMSERYKQGMIDRAEARAIAGESGALGFAGERLMADSFMQEGLDIMSMEQNKSNKLAQLDVNNQSYQARAQGQANEAYNRADSLVGTGLNIAGTVAQAYSTTDAKTLS